MSLLTLITIVSNRVDTCELLCIGNVYWYSFLYIDTNLNYIEYVPILVYHICIPRQSFFVTLYAMTEREIHDEKNKKVFLGGIILGLSKWHGNLYVAFKAGNLATSFRALTYITLWFCSHW